MTSEGASPGSRIASTPEALEGFTSLGFFAADYASVENGKIYASGAYWSLLRFSAFPASLPSCAVVAVVKVPWHAQHADHVLEVHLMDSDESQLAFEVKGEFRTAQGIEARYGEPAILPVAVPIFGLQFDRPGDFSFRLQVDGKELARYPFTVVQVATVEGITFTPPRP